MGSPFAIPPVCICDGVKKPLNHAKIPPSTTRNKPKAETAIPQNIFPSFFCVKSSQAHRFFTLKTACIIPQASLKVKLYANSVTNTHMRINKKRLKIWVFADVLGLECFDKNYVYLYIHTKIV